tara:strand:- start:43084 stop:44139 length:1056 start_codon:yes stop_codon:yes gene_type:complete
MKLKKRILIAPLNWGLGHATRVMPIINELKKNSFEIIISANGRSYELLKKEFPNDKFIKIKGVNIKYSNYLPMIICIAFQIPNIIFCIIREHIILNKKIKKYNIDGVISDNRFGMFSNKIPSVFITHQLNIISPFLEKIITSVNYFLINKYTECWIIDDKKIKIAGKLSTPKKSLNKFCYIGNVSRMKYKKQIKKYDICFLLSGPEGQRKVFENIILKQIKNISGKLIMIQGKCESNYKKNNNNLTVISCANSSDINKYILESKLIVCRSGYSTIMDLKKLNSNAVLVPTPGQTEQEYLAKRLKKQGVYYMQNQNKFNIKKALDESIKYNKNKNFSEKSENTNWDKLFRLF